MRPTRRRGAAQALVIAPAGSAEQMHRLAQAGLVVYGTTLSSAQGEYALAGANEAHWSSCRRMYR